MLSQRKFYDLPLTLANAMNGIVAGTEPTGHPEIMHHHEALTLFRGTAACLPWRSV